MSKEILVLKIGTSAITQKDGSLDEPWLVEIARQVAQLHASYRLVIVSSGAVGTGKRFLPKFSGKIIERKAAAAIGNPILMQKYAQFLSPYKIHIAQSLCERRHFSDRKQFLQLRDTFEELWANDIIPIANENDVVNDLELRFSDNDELATLVAVGFGAKALLLATSVRGLLDANDQLIPRIEHFDGDILGLARKETSGMGLGGMTSKLTFASLATRMGIKVVIFGLKEQDSILKAVAEQTGTLCLPQQSNLKARQKWLASGSLVRGRVKIDDGAIRAIEHRNSLLAVGLQEIITDFEKGEVFEIVGLDDKVVALGVSKLSSQEIRNMKDLKNVEIAHVNDIVVL